MDETNNPKASRRKSGSGRLSFTRSSLRRSKQKLDEFFKSPSLDILRVGSKRKRHKTDDDNVSLQSVDLNIEEPKKKRRSSLAKVGSLANLLSPIRPVKKVGNALTKSLSLRSLTPTNNSSKHPVTPYRKPSAAAPPSPRRRLSTFWYETMDNDNIQQMDKMQIERQEAIFELYKSEEDLIQDFCMVKTMYRDSIQKLGLMSDQELDQIFGDIDSLIPLHQELVDAMKEQRLPDGTTEFVGQIILDWIPRLESYTSYCANQVYAKSLLDAKKQDPAIEDFLQRCQDCPASRRLDLWSFLDVPRSRIVKYPLLLRSIEKLTPPEHADLLPLAQAIDAVEEVIGRVDRSTGRSKCQFTKGMLEYLDEKTQKCPEIESSQAILCDGVLKNNRGTKLHVFLFESILVLTRRATRGSQLRYQVYRQPVPANQLVVEDLTDGQEKRGSFKTAFSNNATNKHQFRVSFRDATLGQSHTLQANDEHDKRQWLQCLYSVLATAEPPAQTLTSEPTQNAASSSSTTQQQQQQQDSQESSQEEHNTSGESLTAPSTSSSSTEDEEDAEKQAAVKAD